jgi:hypothetical protein
MPEKTLKELIALAESQLVQANALINWNTQAAKDGLLVTALGINMALANAMKLTKEAYAAANLQYGIIELDKPVEDKAK